MAFQMPDTFKIRAKATCQTPARTEISARQHRIVVDEPAARGGTDLAASPLETMLAAYLACTNVIANMLAEEMRFEIDDMSFKLTGHFDTRGVFGKADVAVPFPKIELTADIATQADDNTVERFRSELAKRCPVSRILREAGTEFIETWTVTRA